MLLNLSHGSLTKNYPVKSWFLIFVRKSTYHRQDHLKKTLTIVFIFLLAVANGQTALQIRSIDSLNYLQKVDSLNLIHMESKDIIPEYKLVTLLALSYYPELADTRIVFKRSKINTTLNARPTTFSLIFRSRKKRKYVIRINKQQKDSVIYFDHVPFNARIGLLGHEFAHLEDYNNRNFGQIISRLMAYSNKKSKAQFEKEIDQLTIKKGLGWQLYDWSDYVLNKSNAYASYKNFKRMTYLTPEAIRHIIIEGN